MSSYGFHDRDAKMTRDDFRNSLAPRSAPAAEPAAPIPPLVPLRMPVATTLPAASRVLSVQATEPTPVRDLLLSMARQANVDIEIDPAVSGEVMLSVRDRPFLDIVQRICDRVGLRWDFEQGYLRVEPDTPASHTYRIDYLNLVRETASSVSTKASVASTSGNSGGSADNGSTSSVSGKAEANFWAELDAGIRNLLDLAPEMTGAAQPAQNTAQPAATGAGPAAGQGAAQGLTSAQVAAQSAILDAAGIGPAIAIPGALPTDLGAPAVPPARFSLNRQAGLLTVYGTGRQHRLVSEYLRRLRDTVSSQVLIEARVVEVTLNDEFESGINWRSAFGGIFEMGASYGQVVAEPPFTTPGGANPATSGTATFALSNNDITAVANLVQRFGTVRTLSSPRVTVLQNQTAVLKVAENRVFFRLQYETQQSQQGGLSTTTVTSELNTVPVGVIITVQPSINKDTDRIALAVRPTVSRITGYVADPAVAIASQNRTESLVPVVAVQELDSVVTMGSGQVLVMGGLMQDSISSQDTGLPGASEVPMLGHLFKSRTDSTAKRELVVFLKATIVGGAPADDYDIEFYRTYGQDRRPM